MGISQEYQIKQYYIIESEDNFIKHIAKEIYKNTYILEISVRPNQELVQVKGSQDWRVFMTEVDYFNSIATIINVIEFNPN